jgi:hypothetical protein
VTTTPRTRSSHACAPSFGADKLKSLADAVRAAGTIAPTRPHPGVESPAANFLLGPPTAVVDKARDLIRNALGR